LPQDEQAKLAEDEEDQAVVPLQEQGLLVEQ
jgi:hypothetical protein